MLICLLGTLLWWAIPDRSPRDGSIDLEERCGLCQGWGHDDDECPHDDDEETAR
jgi:hypothetical protein